MKSLTNTAIYTGGLPFYEVGSEIGDTETHVVSGLQINESGTLETYYMSCVPLFSGGFSNIYPIVGYTDRVVKAIKPCFTPEKTGSLNWNIAMSIYREHLVLTHLAGKEYMPSYYGMVLVRNGREFPGLLIERFESTLNSLVQFSTPDKFLPIFLRICQFIDDLHDEGFIHADLSPEQIMVNRAGEIKIIDWGTCYSVNQAYNTWSGVSWSKEGFSAPELEGGEVYTASDIYSLGAILKQWWLNNEPSLPSYSQPRRRARAWHFNNAVDKIINKATAWDLAERPYSATELAAEVLALFEIPITPES